MGELVKNDNGTYTIKGGFSTAKSEDMDQIKSLVFKETKEVKKEKKDEITKTTKKKSATKK